MIAEYKMSCFYAGSALTFPLTTTIICFQNQCFSLYLPLDLIMLLRSCDLGIYCWVWTISIQGTKSNSFNGLKKPEVKEMCSSVGVS